MGKGVDGVVEGFVGRGDGVGEGGKGGGGRWVFRRVERAEGKMGVVEVEREKGEGEMVIFGRGLVFGEMGGLSRGAGGS